MKFSYATIMSILVSAVNANYSGEATNVKVTQESIYCQAIEITPNGVYAVVSKPVFDTSGCNTVAVINNIDGSVVDSLIVGYFADGGDSDIWLSDSAWSAIGGDGKLSINPVDWYTTTQHIG